MVIFRELEMEGFKRYNNNKTYKFDEGLIGIFGKNESGKSTIGDAINVSLFGLSSTPYKKNEIVTWGESVSKLRLDFETDILYRVERTLGSKNRAKLKKQINGSWVIVANTIKTVDNQIQDILGFDFKSFKNSIFIGQNDLNSLSSLSRQDRQNIINRLSRYDELSKAESILKDNLKELNTNLNVLENDQKNLEGIVTLASGKYEKLQELKKDHIQKTESLNIKKNELNLIRERIKIFKELKKLNDIKIKTDDQEKFINEKKRELSRITDKENEKDNINAELDKLDYVNKDLEDKITELGHLNSKLNKLTDVETERLKENIQVLEKKIKDNNSLITDKDREIKRIEDKESEKTKYNRELRKFDYLTPDLDSRIEEISKYISEISHPKRESERLGKEKKDKINLVKNEGELESNHKKYVEILNLIDKNHSLEHDVKLLEDKIDRKKMELGDLREETGNLSEIESKYETKKNNSNILVGAGLLMLILGVILGFTLNIILFILVFIGLVPLYKGYTDRKLFKIKLNFIKSKREVFGQLKQLELQLEDLSDNWDDNKGKLRTYESVNMKLLQRDDELFESLSKEKLKLKELEEQEKIVINGIYSIEENLRETFQKLPQHYREVIPFNIETLYKEISKIHQEEDKKKSNYIATIIELDKEIDRKPAIINGKEKLEKENNGLSEQLAEKHDLESQLSRDIKSLKHKLKDEFNGLPIHYKDLISVSNANMDKEVLKIYQNEDKRKSNYITTINGLDKEISRKPEIYKELEIIEQEKQELTNEFLVQKNILRELNTEELNYNPVEHQIIEDKDKKFNQEINQCERRIGDIEGEIRTLKSDTKDLNEKQDELNSLTEKICKLYFTRDVIEIARNEISNTAKMLREQVMERTGKHVFYILPKITNNKYRDVKITEDFKIKVYSPEKNEYESITALSGGARDQVLFSLRLAFTKAILGGRSGSKGFSLFLDEFLGSFDQNRRDETLIMLKGLKDDFRQIFLISHIDGMEGNVDQVIRTPE